MGSTDDTIFLLAATGTLERVPRADYDSEALLQSLIDRYPELLAGEQINPDQPIRWLVVTREAGVPDSEGASDRWAVDHLLLDQDGRPTFVEVKRSKDPRIRREVVGQMLDYAANAQSYWPVDRIRAMAVDRYGGSDALDEEVRRLLSPGSEDNSDQLDAYWSRVHDNLRKGHVRLLFVADELPRELRRVIEFLNEQMQRVEVLGIEVPQYVGQDIKALVPRLIGQSEFARQEKQPTKPQGKTNEKAFLSACPESVARYFASIIRDAQENNLVLYWGVRGFSVRVPRSGGSLCSIFYGYPPESDGKELPFIQVYLGNLENEDDPDAIRRRFLEASPFKEKGRFTLELQLESELLPSADKAASVLWSVASDLRKRG